VTYHNKHCIGRFREERDDQICQERTGEAHSRKIYKIETRLEETEEAALDRQEWRRNVTQCVHMDTGCINVKVVKLVGKHGVRS